MATASASGEATAFRPGALRQTDRFRISVTWLDAVIRWKAEYIDTQELLRRFSGFSEPGPAALAGRTMHKLLETHGPNLTLYHLAEAGFDVRNGHTLRFPMHGREEREVKVVSDRFHRRARLVGVADLLDVDRVTDWKFVGRSDLVSFAEAMQWRCYLAMTKRPKFRYAVYQMLERSYHPGRWLLFGGETLDLYWHRDIEEQVTRGVRELVYLLEKFCADGQLDIFRVAQHPLSHCPYCGANHMRMPPAKDKDKRTGWRYLCQACSGYAVKEAEHTRPRKRKFQDA